MLEQLNIRHLSVLMVMGPAVWLEIAEINALTFDESRTDRGKGIGIHHVPLALLFDTMDELETKELVEKRLRRTHSYEYRLTSKGIAARQWTNSVRVLTGDTS